MNLPDYLIYRQKDCESANLKQLQSWRKASDEEKNEL